MKFNQEEIEYEGKKYIPKFVAIKCPVCNGWGTVSFKRIECHSCEGKGYILVEAKEQ